MTIVVDGLPPLTWSNEPGQAEQPEPGTLKLIAAAGSDWTNDAFGGPQQHAATSLGFTPDRDFSLSARAHVQHPRTTFDAAVLAIWGDRDHWAKLCFEFSPQGQAMVVSVVTNGYSDDCNSTIVTDAHAFLRVTRAGAGWAFHSSRDGIRWDFVRVFRLEFAGPVIVGFMAQTPMGQACVAAFDKIEYHAVVPTDLRNGT
jgi:regulation of enolase protein 1 (concanavalin A-like superfamily)